MKTFELLIVVSAKALAFERQILQLPMLSAQCNLRVEVFATRLNIYRNLGEIDYKSQESWTLFESEWWRKLNAKNIRTVLNCEYYQKTF